MSKKPSVGRTYMFDWLKPKSKDDTDDLSRIVAKVAKVAKVATKIVDPPAFRTAAAEAAENLDPS